AVGEDGDLGGNMAVEVEGRTAGHGPDLGATHVIGPRHRGLRFPRWRTAIANSGSERGRASASATDLFAAFRGRVDATRPQRDPAQACLRSTRPQQAGAP